MSKQTTFIVSCWIERHYRLEIEASSYEEAEEEAERMLDNDEPCHLWDFDDGTHVRISDVQCQDPEWDEESEDEACG